MLTSTQRRLNLPSALDSDLDGQLAPVDDYTPPPIPRAPAVAKPVDTTPSNPVAAAQPVTATVPPATTGGVQGITQLPDGSGGSIAVPPISLAPPGVIAPPTAAPVDTMPWETIGSAAIPIPSAPADAAPWEVAPTLRTGGDVTTGQGGTEQGAAVPPQALAPPTAPPADALPWMPAGPMIGDPLPAGPLTAPLPVDDGGGRMTTGQGIDETTGQPAAVMPWEKGTPIPLPTGVTDSGGQVPSTPPLLPLPPALHDFVGGPSINDAGAATPPLPPAIAPTTETVKPEDQAARGDLSGGGGTGAALPTFTAEQNLVDNVVLPKTSDRLQSINDTTDSLINQQVNAAPILSTQTDRELAQRAAGDAGLTAQDAAPDIAPGNDPRLLKFQNMSDEALNKILNGPDRLALAQQYWDAFNTSTQGDYNHTLTDATNEGAAHGRLQSGMLTNEYGDLEASRERDLNATKARLLADAATGTIGDQQAAYGAVSDAEKNAYGEGASDRGELRTERDARLKLIADHFGQAQDENARAQQLADEQRTERTNRQGLIGTVEGVGATEDARSRADRTEARTERTYQEQLQQEALAERIAQSQMESGDSQQAFENALKLYALGNQGDPTAAYQTAAGQSSAEAQASTGDLAALIKAYLAKQAASTAAGA